MRRDKIFAVFLIFISFAIAGVLQAVRSSNSKEHNLPYLATLESSLIVLDRKCSDELNTYSGLNTEVEDLPAEHFVERQGIIEEFTDKKQSDSIEYKSESEASISFINDKRTGNSTSFHVDIPKLQTLEEAAKDTDTIVSTKATKRNNGVIHKIKSNDNLYNLAKKYYKDQSKWTLIYKANKHQMSDQNSLQVGQELLIPEIKIAKENKRKETQQVIAPLKHKQVL